MSTTTLSAVDRCTRCGAQALVLTVHDHGELLWCSHHYQEHEAALAPLKVLDIRTTLPE